MQYRSLDTEIVKTGEKSARPVVSFIASTANPDRYGDVINQAGWSLAKYRKNPVILLNHNANQLPIGKGEVDVIDGQLMVDIEFDMDDPIAAEVARKTKDGFMGAVSVGFNPIESTPRSMLSKESPYYGKRGEYFERAELLEISIVTIPANGEAVAAKNFIGENRTFKLSELKHIIDVEMDGDKVIVTYLMHEDERREEDPEMPEEEDGHHDEEPEEEMAYHDEESEEEMAMADDKDDEKEKSFLTQTERELFALFTNGE
jgi:HK97 family phage prohead protease